MKTDNEIDFYRVNCKIKDRRKNRDAYEIEKDILFREYSIRAQVLQNIDTVGDEKDQYVSLSFLSKKKVKIESINWNEAKYPVLDITINLNSTINNNRKKNIISHVVFKLPKNFKIKSIFNTSKDKIIEKIEFNFSNEKEYIKKGINDEKLLIREKKSTTITDPIEDFPPLFGN
jgi:hypothetical protein